MAKSVKASCIECGRAIELQKRSLTRYYKRNNTDQYVCASCTASKTGKRQITEIERQMRSERVTQLWKDKSYRQKVLTAHKRATARDDFRIKISENNKKRWLDIKFREKMTKKYTKE